MKAPDALDSLLAPESKSASTRSFQPPIRSPSPRGTARNVVAQHEPRALAHGGGPVTPGTAAGHPSTRWLRARPSEFDRIRRGRAADRSDITGVSRKITQVSPVGRPNQYQSAFACPSPRSQEREFMARSSIRAAVVSAAILAFAGSSLVASATRVSSIERFGIGGFIQPVGLHHGFHIEHVAPGSPPRTTSSSRTISSSRSTAR